jgi:hypothetical protein
MATPVEGPSFRVQFGVGQRPADGWRLVKVALGGRALSLKAAVIEGLAVDVVVSLPDLAHWGFAYNTAALDEIALGGLTLRRELDGRFAPVEAQEQPRWRRTTFEELAAASPGGKAQREELVPPEEDLEGNVFVPNQDFALPEEDMPGGEPGGGRVLLTTPVWSEHRVADTPPEEELEDLTSLVVPNATATEAEQAEAWAIVSERLQHLGGRLYRWKDLFARNSWVFENTLLMPGSASVVMVIFTNGDRYTRHPGSSVGRSGSSCWA